MSSAAAWGRDRTMGEVFRAEHRRTFQHRHESRSGVGESACMAPAPFRTSLIRNDGRVVSAGLPFVECDFTLRIRYLTLSKSSSSQTGDGKTAECSHVSVS